MTSRPYPLDNANPRALEHHALLSALFDEFSLRRAIGLMQPSGRRSLDVGAGGGGFALGLASVAGPHGHVLAIDKDPRHIPHHTHLARREYDLNNPTWQLRDDWDLIHARLTLLHLPQRRRILHHLTQALAPGGVLIVEDWDASTTRMVLSAPDQESAHLYDRFQTILGGKVFAAAGTDRGWARDLHAALIGEGLTGVETVVYGRSWTGGDAGCRLIAGTLEQVRPTLVANGLTHDDLDRLTELLEDPRFVLAGHPLYSTSGWATGSDAP